MLLVRQPLFVSGRDVLWPLSALTLLASVVFLVHGCRESTGAVQSHNLADAATVNTKTCRVRDRTKTGCPPELLAKVMALVPGRDLSIYDRRYKWLSKSLIRVETDYAENIIFMERDGSYVQVNSKDGIEALNEIFQGYNFPRSGFEDIAKVDSFLTFLVELYGDFTYCFVGSSFFVKWTERTQAVYGGTADWLQGSEKDIAVFLDLCRDPVFVFRGNIWTVVFNVFKGSGSVDRWRVTGQFDPKAEGITISTIDIINIKPKGTFSPVMGR